MIVGRRQPFFRHEPEGEWRAGDTDRDATGRLGSRIEGLERVAKSLRLGMIYSEPVIPRRCRREGKEEEKDRSSLPPGRRFFGWD